MQVKKKKVHRILEEARAFAEKCLFIDRVKGYKGITEREKNIVKHCGPTPDGCDACVPDLTINIGVRFFAVAQIMKRNLFRILDVGCGTGILYAEVSKNAIFKRTSPIYVGLDYRNAFLYDQKFACFYESDITAKPTIFKELSVGKGEVITCMEVLEHIDERRSRGLLDHLAGAIGKGGTLLISTPVSEGRGAIDFAFEEKRYGHVFYWSLKELVEQIESFGLKVDWWPNHGLRHPMSFSKISTYVQKEYGYDITELMKRMIDRLGPALTRSIFTQFSRMEDCCAVSIIATRE